MSIFRFFCRAEIESLEEEISALKRALQSATDKLKNKNAENESLLADKEMLLRRYNQVVEELKARPARMEDHCYMNAVETIQKQRAEIDKLNETINDSFAIRDSLARELDNLKAIKEKSGKFAKVMAESIKSGIKAADKAYFKKNQKRTRYCGLISEDVYSMLKKFSKENKISIRRGIELALSICIPLFDASLKASKEKINLGESEEKR